MVATSSITQLIALATHTVGKEAANFGFETLLVQGPSLDPILDRRHQFKPSLSLHLSSIKFCRRFLPSVSMLRHTLFFFLKEKNKLDATYYFIVLLIGSTYFGRYYAHHQELATIMLNTTLVVSFLVCCRLEVRCR